MKTPTIKSRTTTTTTVAPGVPLLVVAAAVLFIVSPLGTLRGVDGLLASKLTSYSDTTCEESMSGASVVRFGVLDAFNASAIRECGAALFAVVLQDVYTYPGCWLQNSSTAVVHYFTTGIIQQNNSCYAWSSEYYVLV